jgi:hypothetical protein
MLSHIDPPNNYKITPISKEKNYRQLPAMSLRIASRGLHISLPTCMHTLGDLEAAMKFTYNYSYTKKIINNALI